MNTSPAPGHPVDLATESVAGEEDPGASIDLAATLPGYAPLRAGEDICRTCGGSGMRNGLACAECEGTGKITGKIMPAANPSS